MSGSNVELVTLSGGGDVLVMTRSESDCKDNEVCTVLRSVEGWKDFKFSNVDDDIGLVMVET